ncbi:MAG: tRNA (adenosine(37)-N6)-threonylcarbamoyltransferase complex dimerization subunit type 1 TsaB [Bacteroidota bacterium]
MDELKDIYLLSIETSQKVGSVAIHKNNELLASHTLYTEKSASSLLTPQIEQILSNCDLKPSELSAIAVAKGPGSYTGLRIAVSTAKGLCVAIDKPLISVNTLEAMACQISPFFPKHYLLCPMLDARRMEVYCMILNQNLEIVEKTHAKIIDEGSFSELLDKNIVVFFGDGAAKCKTALSQNKNAIFLERAIFPNAEKVGELAVKKFEKQQFENLVTFEPYYLKEFIGTVPK